MPSVTFYGGPCARETHPYSAAQLADGNVTCKSVVYDVFDNGRGGFFGVPETAVVKTAPVPALRHATRAWKQLVHGMAVTAPAYLREAGKHRRALLRTGRR